MSGSLASMTGFGAGRAEIDLDGRRHACEVEVRSVNGRHLKLNVRAPDALSACGPRLEVLTRELLGRGTVYLTLRHRDTSGSASRLDEVALRALYGRLCALSAELVAPAPRLDTLCLVPGIVGEGSETSLSEALWPTVEVAARAALADLIAMRQTEGRGLVADLRGIAAEMRAHADAIEADAPAAVAALGERLRARVSELAGDVELSPSDLAREVALLADKADIGEELQRLRSHLDQVEASLTSPGPAGRRLEFLVQELGREANTLTNKCRDEALIQRALELKLGVERLKEQVANLE